MLLFHEFLHLVPGSKSIVFFSRPSKVAARFFETDAGVPSQNTALTTAEERTGPAGILALRGTTGYLNPDSEAYFATTNALDDWCWFDGVAQLPENCLEAIRGRPGGEAVLAHWGLS